MKWNLSKVIRWRRKQKEEPCLGIRANLANDGTCIIKKSNGFMNPEFCTCKEEEE